jgi:hypothetical protein
VACCETDQNELALQVIRGSVEIDPLSPSERRGNKKQHPQQRQRRQFDEEDYDEDLYGRGGGGRGGGDDGGVGRQTHNRGMGRDRERESDRDDYGHTNDSNKNYRGRDGPPPRFAARGNRDTSADDMPADVRDRDRDGDGDRAQGRGAFHEDRDLRNPGLQVSSPKKFMSSLRDMNGGNSEERTAKLKKDQEYQAQLRQQIEEKNRKKEIEKQKEDEIKRQELVQFKTFMAGNTKNKGVGARVEADDSYSYDNNSGDGDFSRRRKNNSDNAARGGRGSSPVDVDDAVGSRRDRAGGNDRRNFQRKPSYDDDDNDGYGGGDNTTNRRGLRKDAGGDRQRDNPLVSKSEYDELSSLCEKLLSQQDNLRDEIDRQAKVIQVSLLLARGCGLGCL